MTAARRYEGGKLVGFVPPAPIPTRPWGAASAPAPRPMHPAPKQGRTEGGRFATAPSKFGFDKLEVGERALVPDIEGLPRWILQRRVAGSATRYKARTGIVIRTGMIAGGVEIERTK